mmetsp:Transcript_5723/g.35650  ORF Transcript_5723/g.35650 Transcript_5723/m.35650 type:complete len:110 (-) Transcript_5723:1933-2262(-)
MVGIPNGSLEVQEWTGCEHPTRPLTSGQQKYGATYRSKGKDEITEVLEETRKLCQLIRVPGEEKVVPLILEPLGTVLVAQDKRQTNDLLVLGRNDDTSTLKIRQPPPRM